MEKSRDISKYINTIRENSDFFSRYYYHALIDLNLIKLDSILKNGILSKKLIEHYKLTSLYTHDSRDFDCKNGNDYISITEYSPNCEFNMLFESFSLHTMTSLSFLISKDISVQKNGVNIYSFSDELFCKDKISIDSIKGILLPENLTNLTIDKVNCLPSDFNCYTKEYINHWLNCVKNYFQMEIPKEYIEKIKISHQQLFEIVYHYENPERWIDPAIREQRKIYGEDIKDILANLLAKFWQEELEINNPTYLDVVTKINQDKLPIYEIKEKCLKKIKHL